MSSTTFTGRTLLRATCSTSSLEAYVTRIFVTAWTTLLFTRLPRQAAILKMFCIPIKQGTHYALPLAKVVFSRSTQFVDPELDNLILTVRVTEVVSPHYY
jgi:hypothetical protein